jgi:hypothetical protein
VVNRQKASKTNLVETNIAWFTRHLASESRLRVDGLLDCPSPLRHRFAAGAAETEKSYIRYVPNHPRAFSDAEVTDIGRTSLFYFRSTPWPPN